MTKQLQLIEDFKKCVNDGDVKIVISKKLATNEKIIDYITGFITVRKTGDKIECLNRSLTGGYAAIEIVEGNNDPELKLFVEKLGDL